MILKYSTCVVCLFVGLKWTVASWTWLWIDYLIKQCSHEESTSNYLCESRHALLSGNVMLSQSEIYVKTFKPHICILKNYCWIMNWIMYLVCIAFCRITIKMLIVFTSWLQFLFRLGCMVIPLGYIVLRVTLCVRKMCSTRKFFVEALTRVLSPGGTVRLVNSCHS